MASASDRVLCGRCQEWRQPEDMLRDKLWLCRPCDRQYRRLHYAVTRVQRGGLCTACGELTSRKTLTLCGRCQRAANSTHAARVRWDRQKAAA